MLGPLPEIRIPPARRERLSNGLAVLIVEKHALPVVDLRVVVRTGAAADTPAEAGRASLTAEMIDEGTERYDALGLAEAIDALGASLKTGVSWDATTLALHVLSPRLAPALDLMAEVLLRPTFPAAELERVRKERLADLLQQQDEPRSLAARAFAEELYGDLHPYGTSPSGTEASIGRFERDALVGFYRTHYHPANAFLVVVGDVDPSSLLPQLESAFGGWAPAPVVAPALPPLPPVPEAARIRVVDKPGAPQSEIRVGQVGPARSTPDYFALVLMNTILGGSFTSRLNMALREERGYTYGAGSRFDFRLGPGPFLAASAVHTDVTDDAVSVFLEEIRRIRDERVLEGELERARNFLALGMPRTLETTEEIARRLAEIELFALGDDYLERWTERIRVVDASDVERVARRYLDPDRASVVVVGDRARVEEPLERLGVGAVEVRGVRG